jgi:hypothetical protein
LILFRHWHITLSDAAAYKTELNDLSLQSSPGHNHDSNFTANLEDKFKAQHEASEERIDSTLRKKFNRFQMSMDKNWIGFKEEIIAIMTPVLHKEINEETRSQLLEQSSDSNETSMRISLLEVENTKLEERLYASEVKSQQLDERKMEMRLNNLEDITKEFTHATKLNQDKAESVQFRLEHLEIQMRKKDMEIVSLKQTQNVRAEPHTRMATPDHAHPAHTRGRSQRTCLKKRKRRTTTTLHPQNPQYKSLEYRSS